MELDRAMRIAAAGMDVQTSRLRVVAENLANRDTTSEVAGGDPFRRKNVTFANRFDRALGANTIRVARVGTTKGEFPTRHDPNHPAANAQGYVKTPNVNSTIETMDMREAQRGYSANLSVLEVSRGMLTRTIEALR